MNWAWDRVLKDLVEASKARADEPQRYICPTKTCRGKVHLRPGTFRRSHFAHNPNEGSESCEDYHPGIYEATSILKSTEVDERSSSKQFGLELSVRNSRTWRLRVRLPVTPYGSGNAEVCYGPDDFRVIDLAGLGNRALYVDVIPCTEPLGIVRFHSNVPSHVKDALAPSAVELSNEKLTLFHAGRLSASGIAGPRYYWGASYYAVSLAGCVRDIPDEILVNTFIERHGWNCHLIRLPQQADESISAWLDANSSLHAGIRRAKIVLIEPSLYIEKPGPEIEALAHKEVRVGIHRLGREMLNDVLRVEDGAIITPISLNNRDHATIEIKVPDRGDRCLYIRFGT